MDPERLKISVQRLVAIISNMLVSGTDLNIICAYQVQARPSGRIGPPPAVQARDLTDLYVWVLAPTPLHKQAAFIFFTCQF
jgi:hypothetical protein